MTWRNQELVCRNRPIARHQGCCTQTTRLVSSWDSSWLTEISVPSAIGIKRRGEINAVNARVENNLQVAPPRVHLDTVLEIHSLSSIGWRRGPGRGGARFTLVVVSNASLPGPVPARSSRGQGVGASGLRTVSRYTRRHQPTSWEIPDNYGDV